MSHTSVLRTPRDGAGFRGRGLRRLPFQTGLWRTARARAVLESPALEYAEKFDDVVGSWNADLPPGAALEMDVRVRIGARWSGWYALGRAEGRPGRLLLMHSPPRQEDARGCVAVDTLKLKRPASALRYRLRFHAPGRPIILRLAAVTVSGPQAPAEPPAFRPGPWVRELRVAGRSQMSEDSPRRCDICSPTSLAAVMAYWGLPRRTLDMARRVRDQSTGDFGDWTFNTAAAGALGLEAFVSRLDSLDELAREIAQGRPVVVSVTFGPGELKGSPLAQTRGHLLVVTGFTARGQVIAMDPAAGSARTARRIYDRRQFHRAWRVNKRGLAYIAGPCRRGLLRVGAPVADLWTRPRAEKTWDREDPEHLTQLLYGEAVSVREVCGDWARVEAQEQLHLSRGGKWQGYPGWLRADSLVSAGSPRPNVVVRGSRARVRTAGGSDLILSLGTKLTRIGQKGGAARLRLLDGGPARAAAADLADLAPMPAARRRSLVLRTAAIFLGRSYYWGGRSSVQPRPGLGVDCSGLVNIAYRACGLDLPRDAEEQLRRSRIVPRRRLRPADLVFLSASPRNRRITHVMLYAGGESLLESRQLAKRALRCTFRKRFHQDLRTLESGGTVTDYTFAAPRRRKIFFGSYF